MVFPKVAEKARPSDYVTSGNAITICPYLVQVSSETLKHGLSIFYTRIRVTLCV